MVTPLVRPVATATVGVEELDLSGGEVSLNARRVPYGEARIEVPLISPEDIELLDPRDDLRIQVTGGDSVDGSGRVFDLGLRSRSVNHRTKKITLELASDEALLMDYAQIITDTGARAHEASLRAVCDYVLGKIGSSLGEAGPDADVSAYWPITNLVPNPSGEADAGGSVASKWSVGQFVDGNVVTVVMSSPAALSGSRAVGWTSLAGGDSNIIPAANGAVTSYAVRPGNWYTWSFYICSTSSRTARAAIQWWSANGTILSSQVFSAPITTVNTEFRRVHVIAQAPAGTTHAYPYVNVPSSAVTNHYVERAMFYEGNELVPYFDGDSTDDANYTYDWSNGPHASTSTREPVVERLPDIFSWEPGVSAWDFLAPLTSIVGLRLFCDEARTWRLIDPADYSVPGVVSIASHNATEGVDRIDRSDPNVDCTGVVVLYRWQDADGIERRAYDAAGEPGRVLRWEYERPYPGPGAAAAILARRTGAGRVQEVTALANWLATPGSEAAITLPATVQQIGTLTSVRWDLTSGLMAVGSSGLIEALPGSWLAWDPDEAWEDVDAGLEWEDA